MKLNCFQLIVYLLFPIFCISQKETTKLSPEDTKSIVEQAIDTMQFLRQAANDACKCISKISTTNKNSKVIANEIGKCIDEQTTSFQLVMKVYYSMIEKDNKKEIKVTVDDSKSSNEYKSYYFKIERYLTDSCGSLKKVVNADNKESEVSSSKNSKALKEYNLGTDYLAKENYKEALIYFQKAVSIDEKFAFAWDNIGICQRHLGNFQEAINAYNKSLELDSTGHVPLQNIPVAYEYLKEYDNAIEAYQKLLRHYNDDPEVFYGVGRIYYEYKKDNEKALDNMCKAYNLYIQLKSPYRTDAEKIINLIYSKMKETKQEDKFYEILKANNIKTN